MKLGKNNLVAVNYSHTEQWWFDYRAVFRYMLWFIDLFGDIYSKL